MANPEHLARLIHSAREDNRCEAWNQWRKVHSKIKVDLRKAGLTGMGLSGVNLSGANLEGASLRVADLLSADLSQTNLQCTNMRYANLTGANLMGADLSHADLFRALLVQANLISAVIHAANFFGASLFQANLIGADLSGSSLEQSDLRMADFCEAKLVEVNLTSSQMAQTDLSLADLKDAQLKGVQNLQVSQIIQCDNLVGLQGVTEDFLHKVKDEKPGLMGWWKGSEISYPGQDKRKTYRKYTVRDGEERSFDFREKEIEAILLHHRQWLEDNFIEREEFLYFLKNGHFIYYEINYDSRLKLDWIRDMMQEKGQKSRLHITNQHSYREYRSFFELLSSGNLSSEMRDEITQSWPEDKED